MSFEEVIFHLVVVFGTIVSLLVAKARTGTYLSTALCYSAGWVLLLISYNYTNFFPSSFDISRASFLVVSKVAGAGFVGIILGHLFFGKNRTDYRKMHRSFDALDHFLRKYYYYVIGAMFLVGMAAFIQRFSMVGFSIFSLVDLRQIHVNTQLTIFQRAATYLTFLWYSFLILTAIADVLHNKVNVMRLVLGITAMVPLALSKASRGEFLAPFVVYGMAMFLVFMIRASSGFGGIKFRLAYKTALRVVPLILLLLVLITVYGQLRQVESKALAGRYQVFGIVQAPIEASYEITSYFAVSLYAAGPITEWVDVNEPRLYGRQYFEVFYKIPEKIGIVPDYGIQQYYFRQNAFNELRDGKITFTPGTMAKILTREVGLKLAPVAALAAMFLTVGITTLVPCNTIPGAVLSVLFLRDAFLSFQTLDGFGMNNIWVLAVSLLIAYFYKRKYPKLASWPKTRME